MCTCYSYGESKWQSDRDLIAYFIDVSAYRSQTLSSSTFSFENENKETCSRLFGCQELTQEILQLVQDVSGMGESSPLDVGIDKMVRHSRCDMRCNMRAPVVSSNVTSYQGRC